MLKSLANHQGTRNRVNRTRNNSQYIINQSVGKIKANMCNLTIPNTVIAYPILNRVAYVIVVFMPLLR